ncbi:hypothetical protein BKA70DRAFT_197563 [Coprinopsis sp. MPI-PUGE-AT-0042]|nr:hypothetical protein BKA70DRAFT_197563 [Coprinopsis sp. MPI-PUGE-AT-0042]
MWRACPRPAPSMKSSFQNAVKQFRIYENETVGFRNGGDGIPEGEALPKGTRHALHHDAESIFWVMFHGLLVAQPEEASGAPPQSLICPSIWGWVFGIRGRNYLVQSHYPDDYLHPLYQPLEGLILSLSGFLRVDPYWLRNKDPWCHPEFIRVCMQRTIYDFLVKHGEEDFMDVPISKASRQVKPIYIYLLTCA